MLLGNVLRLIQFENGVNRIRDQYQSLHSTRCNAKRVWLNALALNRKQRTVDRQVNNRIKNFTDTSDTYSSPIDNLHGVDGDLHVGEDFEELLTSLPFLHEREEDLDGDEWIVLYETREVRGCEAES